MSNAVFSFEPFDFGGAQDVYSLVQGYEREEEANKGKQTQLLGTEDWVSIDDLCSDYGFSQDNTCEKGILLSKDHEEYFSDFGVSDNFQFDTISPTMQSCQESTELDTSLSGISNLAESKKEKPYRFSLTSLELLNNYQSGFKRFNSEKLNEQSSATCATVIGSRELSTEEVMRVAGDRFIQLSGQNDDNPYMLRHPYGCALSGLTEEETKDVDLAHLLFASAEKVGNGQLVRASKLLVQCSYLSSSTGNPVQRVVYYFANALRERIDQEMGTVPLKRLEEPGRLLLDLEAAMMSPNPANLACHLELPFGQVLQFSAMQTIIENVASSKKVHLIDLGIRMGIQYTVLMQALATRVICPVELFKITAVGISRQMIEETGKRLASFAETLNLPFSFKIVIVSDMKDFNEDLFELEADEVVAVYSALSLRNMIAWPHHLETLMKVIRNLNPCIMVVIEVEGNHNSSSFVKRFIEALFFYSAYFDCIEACMDRNNPNRMTTEEAYFGRSIRNIVATEGEERTVRHVGIHMWRAFFTRYGMVETELSQSCLYQASLILKQFACGNSCTLDMNGNCLTVGWKGTPLNSLSAWKFH